MGAAAAAADIEEVDAVVSTIGGSSANPAADGQGNMNVINAALKKGVKKFILVTSIGCGDTKDAPGPQVYDILKPVLLEKNKAEELLMVSERVRSAAPGSQALTPATSNHTAPGSSCTCISTV